MRTTSLLDSTFNFATGTYELDARVVPFEKAHGKELQQLIFESLWAAHKWIVREFPERLIVTQKQFAFLNDYTDEVYHTTDRLFTVLDEQGKVMCVMEVMIDDEYDIVDEIAAIKEESDRMLAEVDFTKLAPGTKVITPASVDQSF